MKVEVESLSPVKKKITVEVPTDAVAKEVEAAYKSIKGSTTLPGFRKGKVPEKIIRQKYSGDVLGDVARSLIEKTYPEAVKEKDISPVENPSIEIEKIAEDAPFLYSATVEVAPVIDVTGYRGLKLERKTVEVTAREVDEALERLRETRGEFKLVERPAAKGDMTVIDFDGTVEGQPIKGGSAKDYSVVLGEGTLLPGFHQSLAGKSAGAELEVKTTFPDYHHDKDLVGKEGTFNVTVKAVKERSTPALDDEFAKDLNCASLEELKGKVEEELKNSREREEKERLRTEALEKLMELNPFELPEALVTRYLTNILGTVIDNMRKGIMHPEDKGLKPEELKERYRGAAEKRARADLIIDSVAAKENVEVTPEEVEADISAMASKTNTTPEAVKGRIEKEGALDYIKDGLKREKVLDIITESRIIVKP
jgi:trigger factor